MVSLPRDTESSCLVYTVLRATLFLLLNNRDVQKLQITRATKRFSRGKRTHFEVPRRSRESKGGAGEGEAGGK